MINTKQSIAIVLLLIVVSGFSQNKQNVRPWLTGNKIVEFIPDKKETGIFNDPIDDTINFKKVVDNIYKDKEGKVYIRTACFRPRDDNRMVFLEYFKDMTGFLDVKTYKPLKEGFFQNKGKVHYWGANSDGEYVIDVTGADPKTFVPFTDVGGGIDKSHVYYGGVPSNFEVIKGADPKTIKVLNPERGCWNCGNCYFVDSKSVFFGFTKVEGADPKTFKLVNKENIDAVDKNGKYFDGKRID